MDPDANLAELRRLTEKINGLDEPHEQLDPADALRVVELFVALDEWLSRGGFPPAAWGTRSGQ